MRGNGNRIEQTGFEEATEEELELAFYHTVNELLVRWGCLQDQLGNFVVSIYNSVYHSTKYFPESPIFHVKSPNLRVHRVLIKILTSDGNYYSCISRIKRKI